MKFEVFAKRSDRGFTQIIRCVCVWPAKIRNFRIERLRQVTSFASCIVYRRSLLLQFKSGTHTYTHIPAQLDTKTEHIGHWSCSLVCWGKYILLPSISDYCVLCSDVLGNMTLLIYILALFPSHTMSPIIWLSSKRAIKSGVML